MSIQARSWLWLWLSIALFVGVMGREVWQFMHYDSRYPVRFERAEVLNSPGSPGGELQLRIWREKVRDDCPVSSKPFAIDVNGALFAFEESFSRGGPVGTEYFDASYPIPRDLPPGEYVLRDRLSYYCPSITFSIVQPLARFVVR